MMHGHEKSDSVIVAVKPANKAGQRAAERSAVQPTAAEPVEPRAETKGNAGQRNTCRAQHRISVPQALDRIRKVAKERKKERFTALLHHISTDLLEEAFFELKKDAAPGVDGLMWKDYEADLERKLEDLHDRVQRGAYRARPSRRVYIPKSDGRQRPLAVAALEDKIVQRAVVTLLNAIYEEDFLGISYGFRPGRGTHDAMDALCVGIHSKKVSFILDADIRSFFDEISQEWLIRFLEHRIADRRIIRLIQKWLKAGVLEDGIVTVDDRGTGQGSVISPMLANIYLHYALDLWAARWRRREATGNMIIVRYADDFIIGFQHENDARRFLDEMRERALEADLDLVRVLLVDELLELGEALARDDHTSVRERRRAIAERAIDVSEPMSIRGHHAQLAGFGDALYVDAVQVVPGLVGRRGVHRALDHLGEYGGLDDRQRFGREVGKARILLRGGSRERELRARTAQREIGVARCLEVHLLLGKLAHEVVQFARGDR